ncbi:MAG: TIGR03016 family PEP-CTERM system-associated outer membrane protein [Sulfuriferula sp.]
MAADWRMTPNLTVSERYTDNVNFASSGQSKESDFITEIRPGVQIYKDGARLKVRVNYSLQSLTYLNNSNNNSLNHQLNASANAELLKDFLFLDANTAIAQQNINALGPVGFGNTNATKNLTTVGTYSISPYIKKRFGSFADGDFRVRQSGIYYNSQGISNTLTNNVTGSLLSGSSFNDLFWGVNYSYTKNKNQLVADTEFESASATLGYALTRKLRVHATAGQERNNYISANGSAIDGPFWNAGFTWTPTSRTSVAATYGHRFFGRTYSFDLSERTRHTNWRAGYSENLTTSSATSLSYTLLGGYYVCQTIPAGYSYFPATGSPTGFVVAIPLGDPVPADCQIAAAAAVTPNLSLVGEVFILKNLTAGVGVNIGKSDYNLGFYSMRRDLQTSGNYDRQSGVNAGWNWHFAPRTTFNLYGNLSRIEVPSQNRKDDLWMVSSGVTHQFQPKLTGSVFIRHQARSSNLPGNDFTENSITALVNMTF